MSLEPLSDSEIRFAGRAVRRVRLFRALAFAGVAIAVALSVFYTYRKLTDPSFAIGARGVVVLLILLNARQNLRQYRYATLLAKLGDLRDAASRRSSASASGNGFVRVPPASRG